MISINSRRKRFLSAYTIKLTSYASHDALRGGNSCCERADPNNKIHKNNGDILLLWSTNSKMIDEDKLLGWWMLWDILPRPLRTHESIWTPSFRQIRCHSSTFSRSRCFCKLRSISNLFMCLGSLRSCVRKLCEDFTTLQISINYWV